MVIINILKIVFLLGFLVFIHEFGHFLMAKKFGVVVEEFSIGFGPQIFSKEKNGTKYKLCCIPFGGYVKMLGEEKSIEKEGSFSNAKLVHRILISAGGPIVNITFALIVFFVLSMFYEGVQDLSFVEKINFSFRNTAGFGLSMIDGLKMLFTGQIGIDQMTGPVGISQMVVKTSGLFSFIYLLSLISLSLGVTNLLPFPALDGGRIVLLVLEGIRGKALNEEIEIKIQTIGFLILMTFALYITYEDILRIF